MAWSNVLPWLPLRVAKYNGGNSGSATVSPYTRQATRLCAERRKYGCNDRLRDAPNERFRQIPSLPSSLRSRELEIRAGSVCQDVAQRPLAYRRDEVVVFELYKVSSCLLRAERNVWEISLTDASGYVPNRSNWTSW